MLKNLREDKKFLGGRIGEIEGHKCPRCNSTTGYIFQEPFGYIWFCATSKCLQDDISYQNKDKKPIQTKSKDASSEFNLGIRYFNASLAKMKAKQEEINIISRWMNIPKNMLVVMGVPGTGKTYLCMAIANYLFEKNLTPVFYREHDFYGEIQNSFSNDKNQFQVINRIANYDFLILDDIGACGQTDWKEEVFFDLIDRRYSNQKPTVITTNMSMDSIQQIWGDRIARRFNSPENTKVVLTECYDGS